MTINLHGVTAIHSFTKKQGRDSVYRELRVVAEGNVQILVLFADDAEKLQIKEHRTLNQCSEAAIRDAAEERHKDRG